MSSPAVSLPDALWSAAADVIGGVADATLVCHVAPDGDALGSMLALARGLRGRGIDVTCTWGDERWPVPASNGWLPDIDTVDSTWLEPRWLCGRRSAADCRPGSLCE